MLKRSQCNDHPIKTNTNTIPRKRSMWWTSRQISVRLRGERYKYCNQATEREKDIRGVGVLPVVSRRQFVKLSEQRNIHRLLNAHYYRNDFRENKMSTLRAFPWQRQGKSVIQGDPLLESIVLKAFLLANVVYDSVKKSSTSRRYYD